MCVCVCFIMNSWSKQVACSACSEVCLFSHVYHHVSVGVCVDILLFQMAFISKVSVYKWMAYIITMSSLSQNTSWIYLSACSPLSFYVTYLQTSLPAMLIPSPLSVSPGRKGNKDKGERRRENEREREKETENTHVG